tara:strand:+ start:887 stop:1519 length:633 start_codon:yes stop_codon:yes gene_type:complete
MVTDPVTGEQLPMPGDEEMGMPPGADPMSATPGEVTPEMVSEAGQEVGQAQMDQVGAFAPPPTKPYSIKIVKSFASELDKTIDFLAGEDLPLPEWSPSPDSVAKGDKWDQPLPPEIFAPAAALSEAVRMIDTEGKFADQNFNAAELVDDSSVRSATAKLKLMAKNQELANLLQQPVGGGGPEGSGVPMNEAEPADMAMDDEEADLLMENM